MYGLRRKKKNKYGAKKTTIDGIEFDSKKEAEKYICLKYELERGEIQELELQPKFILLKPFKHDGETVRGISYKPDFLVTHNDGMKEVIDVKGVETRDFKIRWKLLKYKLKDQNYKFTIC